MKSIVFICCLLFFGCSQQLYQPIGLGLTAAFSDASVMKAIREGASQAGWQIVSSKEREALARYEDGDDFAEVRIRSNRAVIDFEYVRSEGFGYDAAGSHPQIAMSYNTNLQELEEEIAMQLAEALASN